jgi:hypothetical protein
MPCPPDFSALSSVATKLPFPAVFQPWSIFPSGLCIITSSFFQWTWRNIFRLRLRNSICWAHNELVVDGEHLTTRWNSSTDCLKIIQAQTSAMPVVDAIHINLVLV